MSNKIPTQSIEALFNIAFRANIKGAGGTRARAQSTFNNFAEFARKNNWGIVTPMSVTPKQLIIYFNFRSNKNPRTLQNEVSHFRRAMRGAGRNLGNLRDPNNVWSNKKLHIPSASRKSNKPAMPIEVYLSALENASEGMHHVLILEFEFGLRGQEAVKAKRLEQWAVKLANQDPAKDCYLSLGHRGSGSKGGRDRDIYIPSEKIAYCLQIIEEALEFRRRNGGQFFKAESLKKALSAYHRQARKLGLKNHQSPHALRRSFTQNQVEMYMKQGLSKETALSDVSQDLGHGDKRGRWVENNYYGGMVKN